MDLSTKRWAFALPKFDEPFGVRFHFFFFFGEPMSVNARVVLLAEDDLTLYTTVTIVPTKR
jgi:hypothetical protein